MTENYHKRAADRQRMLTQLADELLRQRESERRPPSPSSRNDIASMLHVLDANSRGSTQPATPDELGDTVKELLRRLGIRDRDGRPDNDEED